MKVFVGITGASGAPYASRLLEQLVARNCEVGLCVSDAGVQVLATELFEKREMSRAETLRRLLAPLEGKVQVFDPDDYFAPFASGSAQVEVFVICPCSMSSAGQIAAGAGSNLIHRAAAVALKEERKLLLVPRETPLSSVQLESLLKLRQAGATILFAAPSFYGQPKSMQDLVDTVVARVLDQLGLEHELAARWGEGER
ncbi:MAG TPA: UbiX family flavin prenyltransferase [Gaiellaceae bacterium]